jgi:two-component system, OmpR family, response regulator MtrA
MAGALRPRVTVLDDSPELAELLGDVLRSDGLDVSLLDGETNLQDIEDSAPDLLVLDWRLAASELTGLDIIRQARSQPALRAVPIIVCSAALDEVAAHADELEVTPRVSVLPKPFSLEELEASVQQALG